MILGIEEGRNDDIGKKRSAIFFEAKPFFFVAPFSFGAKQFHGGLSGIEICLGIEAGKVLADDLLAGVAFDFGGTGAPAGNNAIWAEGDDGVVENRVDDRLMIGLDGERFGQIGEWSGWDDGIDRGQEKSGDFLKSEE